MDRVRKSATFGDHPAEDAELEYVVSPFFPELCLVGQSNSEQKKSKLVGHSRKMLRRDNCSRTPTAVAVIAQKLLLGGAEQIGRLQSR